jgi:integrase
LTVLHGIFKRAKRVYGLRENPASADLVERPKVVYTGEFDTYGRDELEQLATAAESPQDATLYRVAAFTGLRTGELFALRWRDVDFVGGLVHVRHNWDHKFRVEKVPKGKRVRSVPLMADAMDALAILKGRENFTADGDLVFCSEVGEHLDYYSHRRRYQDSLKRAGLRKIKFHDLRHAFGTSAITELDPYSVQSYMGHSNYSTTQRYLHHKPRPADAAALQRAFRTASHTANSGESRVTQSNSDNPDTLEVPEQATT